MTETPTHDPELELARQWGALRGEADGRRAAINLIRTSAYLQAFHGELKRASLCDCPDDEEPLADWERDLLADVKRACTDQSEPPKGIIPAPGVVLTDPDHQPNAAQGIRDLAKAFGVNLDQPSTETHDAYGTPITPPVELHDDDLDRASEALLEQDAGDDWRCPIQGVHLAHIHRYGHYGRQGAIQCNGNPTAAQPALPEGAQQ